MKNLLFNLKNLFKFINVIFIIVYLYPGSLLGCIFYGNCEKQPQISPDYIVSSNHVYIFSFVSIIGFFAYLEVREMKLVFWYLIFISIFLELLHYVIPNRGFQFADLFSNIFGVILSLTFFKIYKYAKKFLF
jgi:hypothetical protein